MDTDFFRRKRTQETQRTKSAFNTTVSLVSFHETNADQLPVFAAKPKRSCTQGCASFDALQRAGAFHLPFKSNLHETALPSLKHRLRNADLRSLLFLRRLCSVEWQDSNGENGEYRSERKPFGVLRDAERVTLSAKVGGVESAKEEWLVLHTEATPPNDVIERLLLEAEDDDARERITRSASQPQPIDIAFRITDETLVPTEGCVVFAYLPTQKETHLRFLFQARYVTTPGRDNIEKDNEWNKWLLKHTAAFLPAILVNLRDAGMLTPDFLDVLPVAGDGVPDFLAELSGSLTTSLQEQALIPTENGGHSFAKQIFYPASEELRRLLSSADLSELTGIESAVWLHSDIRDTKASQRRFDVVKAAGVAEISAGKLVTWLAKKGADWIKSKDDAWLFACYRYLNGQAAEKERVKKLPLVRVSKTTTVGTFSGHIRKSATAWRQRGLRCRDCSS